MQGHKGSGMSSESHGVLQRIFKNRKQLTYTKGDIDMNSTNQLVENKKYNTKDLVITSLLIAIVFVATAFINIRLPISINGGLIHLGTGALIVSSILYGKKKGAIAGAFGMAIFDIFSGWAAWAPFTFIVRGVMGYIIGSIAYTKGEKSRELGWNIIGIILGGIWMIAGYYATEGILYGNWSIPVTSIPGNAIQILVGAVIGLPLIATLKKLKLY